MDLDDDMMKSFVKEQIGPVIQGARLAIQHINENDEILDDIVELQKKYYDKLKDKGFTSDQATKIVSHSMGALNKTQNGLQVIKEVENKTKKGKK
jgi:phosphotransacetylase